MDQVRAIVTAWRESTELSAARCMYELAAVLGVEPPKPVAGKRRTRGSDDA